MVRKSRGRQKIQMTRMSKESNLLVTFSKRRSGLFKKASELCTLCGAEIAIIVFSPGKKVFSFGHPGVEAIVDRYLEMGQAPPPPPAVPMPAGRATAMQLVEAHRSASIQELNMQLNEVLGVVEAERVKGEDLSRLRKEGRGEGRWWEAQIGEMSLAQLEQLGEAMEDLKKKVFRQVEKMMMMMPPPPPQFAGGVVEGRGGDGGGETGVGVMEGMNKDMMGGGVGQLTVTPHGFTLGFGSTTTFFD